MERYYKLLGILVFTIISLYSNAWAIVVGFTFLLQIACLWEKGVYTIIFIPLTFSLITSVGCSYWGMALGIIAIYIIRCLCKDTYYNDSRIWTFFLLLFIGTLLFVPYIAILPLVLLCVTLPIYEGFSWKISGRQHLSTIVIISLICVFAYCCWGFGKDRNRAYLQKGVWANAKTPYDINNLRNASCYSYSEFVKLIKADTISNLQNIPNYTELWIVTPTIPFNESEISLLKKWVGEGGNLILVSDHTDLYGHARCVNQIATAFGCHINYSATFDKNDKQVFYNAFHVPFDIKVGTNMTGLAFPLLSAWMWEEDAYYANENFFGPLEISGDDTFGNKLIIGQIAYGLGQVSFLQDSTIFSNFSVYQPYVMDIARSLSNHSFLARILFLFPFIFWVSILCSIYGKQRLLTLFSPLFIFCIPITDAGTFDYGEDPQIWTGNSTFVQENGCPHTKVSSIYSLSALSKRKPLWISNVSATVDDVIWVDSINPPNPNWRWIKVEDKHYVRQQTDSPWDSLYQVLDTPYMKSWEHVSNNFAKIDVNPIFNDRVMNDWWYNDGISKNRYARIHGWINWLNESKENVSEIKYDEGLFTKERYKAVVCVEGKEPVRIYLPKPQVANGTEIYLGNGIAGYFIQRGDSVSIFGKGQYCENFGCPKIWAIDYWKE